MLITGATGFLGRVLVDRRPDVDIVGIARSSAPPARWANTRRRTELRHLNLAERESVATVFESVEPAMVIHCAYGTDDLGRDILDATANVAAAAGEVGAELVHISTDVVFSGDTGPYDEASPPDPITPYGRAKAEAEEIVLGTCPDAAIVRTSLLTRADPIDPRSAWVLEGGPGLTLFTDEIRCPAAVEDVADICWQLAAGGRKAAGVWHAVGSEAVSRHELGRRILSAHGRDPDALVAALSAGRTPRRPLDLTLTAERVERDLRLGLRPVSSIFGPVPS